MKTNTQINLHKPKRFTELQKDILSGLVYFNIFEFPLKPSEIQNLTVNHYSEKLVLGALAELMSKGVIFGYDGFYSCQKEVKPLVDKRIENQRSTGKFFSVLPRYVRLISKFPFVRAVAISGSLSKGVLHENGDIDYFIITQKGRLWLARTLLILYKKTVLLNSKEYFCVNYFISEDNLLLEDQNRFTATEVSFLIPVYNPELIDRFKETNQWLHQFYGHFEHPIELETQTRDGKRSKRFLEIGLNNVLGNWLETTFMKITMRKWMRKFPHFDPKKFELTMRSRSDISKHHPQDFQTKVLDQFEKDLHNILGE